MPPVMTESVLVACVDGNDLDNVAPLLRERFQRFITNRKWEAANVDFVEQKHAPDPNFPDYLPDWDLGLRVGLAHVTDCPTWFTDVEAVVGFLADLHSETGRDFLLYLSPHTQRWLQEHLVFVDGKVVDLPLLREMITRFLARSSDT